MKKTLTRIPSGFSLVEMLVVIAILAVLGGFGFGTYMLVNKQAKVEQAAMMIEQLSSSLEVRGNQPFSKLDLDDLQGVLSIGSRYPDGDGSRTSTTGLLALLSGDYDSSGRIDDARSPMFPQIDPDYQGKGKYAMDGLIVDPWLNPLRYEFPGYNNNVEDGFDIWSAGPDGVFDTEDDVKNW